MTWHSESDTESTRKGSHTGTRTVSGSESPATMVSEQSWWRAKPPVTKDTECARCHNLFERSGPRVKYCGPECHRLARLALARARYKEIRPPRTKANSTPQSKSTSTRMGQMREPQLCACRNNLAKTVWHCPTYGCSRWKPSASLMCTRCVERAWWSG